MDQAGDVPLTSDLCKQVGSGGFVPYSRRTPHSFSLAACTPLAPATSPVFLKSCSNRLYFFED